MKAIRLIFVLIVSMFTLVSCKHRIENSIRKTAEAYLLHRFSYHFNESMFYCSPSMRSHMRWIASNLSQDDIHLLCDVEDGLGIALNKVNIIGDTAIVTCRVENVLLTDSIEGKHYIGKRELMITLSRKDGVWYIIAEN